MKIPIAFPFPLFLAFKRKSRTPIALLSLFAFMLTAGCGGSNHQNETPFSTQSYSKRCGLEDIPVKGNQLPEPEGSFCIGKTSAHLVDSNRPETFTEKEGDFRELSLSIWFPAQASGASKRAPYMDEALLDIAVPTGNPSERISSKVKVFTNARENAAMPSTGKFPVILFSPGLGANSESYSGLLEGIASHGYVIVAIDHAYVSGVTRLQDASIATSKLGEAAEQAGDSSEPENTATPIVVEDQRFVLRWLQESGASTAAKKILAGHLDMQHVTAMGHSYGGSTSVQTSRVEPLVRAAINLDGTVYGDKTGPWLKPMMFLQSEQHYTVVHDYSQQNGIPEEELSSFDYVWNHRQQPGIRRVIPGTGHNDFGDLKLLAQTYWKSPTGDQYQELGLGSIKYGDAMKQIRGLCLEFLSPLAQ